MEYNPGKLTWLAGKSTWFFFIRRYMFIHFFPLSCHCLRFLGCNLWWSLRKLSSTFPHEIQEQTGQNATVPSTTRCHQGWVFRLEVGTSPNCSRKIIWNETSILGGSVFREVHADNMVLMHFCSRLFFKLIGISNKKQRDQIVKTPFSWEAEKNKCQWFPSEMWTPFTWFNGFFLRIPSFWDHIHINL